MKRGISTDGVLIICATILLIFFCGGCGGFFARISHDIEQGRRDAQRGF